MLKTLITKGYIEGGMITSRNQQPVNIAKLPAILRTLLVTDGTVTKTLEAYFWEPIGITPQQQTLINLSQPLPDLHCDAGAEVLKRDVIIAGQHSQQTYAIASSLLNLRPLPNDVQQQLIAGEIGIGELLRDQGLETFRQVIDIFTMPDEQNKQNNTATNNFGEHLSVSSEQQLKSHTFICRTYLIVYNNEPVIQVTEKFPMAFYANL